MLFNKEVFILLGVNKSREFLKFRPTFYLVIHSNHEIVSSFIYIDLNYNGFQKLESLALGTTPLRIYPITTLGDLHETVCVVLPSLQYYKYTIKISLGHK